MTGSELGTGLRHSRVGRGNPQTPLLHRTCGECPMTAEIPVEGATYHRHWASVARQLVLPDSLIPESCQPKR